MEIQTLRWFRQVADGVTVSEVGDLENTTQPGVWRPLARLEAELGTPLLSRPRSTEPRIELVTSITGVRGPCRSDPRPER